MKQKKPWYIWLSLVGFVYLMCRLQYALVREEESWRQGLRRCLSFWGMCLYLFAGQVLLPAALALEVWRRVSWPHTGAQTAALALVGLLIYLTGVAAAWRLERLRREVEG